MWHLRDISGSDPSAIALKSSLAGSPARPPTSSPRPRSDAAASIGGAFSGEGTLHHVCARGRDGLVGEAADMTDGGQRVHHSPACHDTSAVDCVSLRKHGLARATLSFGSRSTRAHGASRVSPFRASHCPYCAHADWVRSMSGPNLGSSHL